MTVETFIAHAPVILTGAVAVILLGLFLTVRQNAATEHAMVKARRDAAFARWAQWTFISVSDADGNLFYRSLYDLQDDPDDLIWANPKAVILFHTEPEETAEGVTTSG